MKVLTVRGIDAKLGEALRAEAQRRGMSMNALVLEVLREGLGMAAGGPRTYHDLDFLFGSWTREEAQAFDRVIEEEFEQIDWNDWQ